MLLSKTKEKYEKAFGASERALDSYRRADDDLNLSRAEVEKQRMNSTIKSQQYDEFKNEYANQLQKSNELQNKYYNQSLPNVFHGLQDMDERRIKCIKNFILKAVQVEKEVLPIVSQCLDGMAQCAESIDENEVKTLPLVLKQEIFVSFTEFFFFAGFQSCDRKIQVRLFAPWWHSLWGPVQQWQCLHQWVNELYATVNQSRFGEKDFSSWYHHWRPDQKEVRDPRSFL